jgi:SAM-dependent methyltransferase
MNFIEKLHSGLVYDRRVRTLVARLSELLPGDAKVLDVGCGDGLVDKLIMENRPDVSISGVDVLIRPKPHILVKQFDGHSLPFEDMSFDAVLFVDVLHHTEDPAILLKEAARVARQAVVIKDHLENGLWDRLILRFMDWVGNAHHGVVLPYNYWPEWHWRKAFATVGLQVDTMTTHLGLYIFPFSLLFDRRLHFVARLNIESSVIQTK